MRGSLVVAVVLLLVSETVWAGRPSTTFGKTTTTRVAPGESPTKVPVLKAKVGEEAHVLVRLTTRVKVAEGPRGTMSDDLLVPLKLRVEEAPAQGGATIAFEVEAAPPDWLSEAQRERAAKFLGRRGSYQISPTGRLTSVRIDATSGSDEYRRTVDLGIGTFDMPFVGVLESWGGLGETAPAIPLGVGTQWKSVTTLTKGDQTTTSTATHTWSGGRVVSTSGATELVGTIEAGGAKTNIKNQGPFEFVLLENFLFIRRASFESELVMVFMVKADGGGEVQSMSSRFTLEVVKQR